MVVIELTKEQMLELHSSIVDHINKMCSNLGSPKLFSEEVVNEMATVLTDRFSKMNGMKVSYVNYDFVVGYVMSSARFDIIK
jgi:hypothetical protein